MRAFEFQATNTVQDAMAAGAGRPDVRYIAGGTTLLDLMKLEVETPLRVIDIHRLPLAEIGSTDGGGVRIGAMATNSDVAYNPLIQAQYPVLAEAVLAGASAQLRNMATVGGNLMQRTRCTYFRDTFWACNKREPGSGCSAKEGFHRNHAIFGVSDACFATHPSDMAVALLILDARVEIQNAGGTRSVPLSEFHLLPGATPERETVIEAGDLITAVEIPSLEGSWRGRYIKVRDRESYEFALVSVAAMLSLDGKRIRSARLAFGGVGTKPWRAAAAEEVLNGNNVDDRLFQRAAERAVEGAQPHRDNGFKVELLKRTVLRTFRDLTEEL